MMVSEITIRRHLVTMPTSTSSPPSSEAFQGLCPLWSGMCSQHFPSAFALPHLASAFSLGAPFLERTGESSVLGSGPTAQWLPDLD